MKNARWVRDPIDAFIIERLEREKLQPSPEADKVALVRRLSLDLIGLPPTIEEVDAFVADKSPDAYEKQVERLLKIVQKDLPFLIGDLQLDVRVVHRAAAVLLRAACRPADHFGHEKLEAGAW